jgi:hypothetical protein
MLTLRKIAGGGTMIPIIFAAVLLSVLAVVGLYVGVRIGRAVRDQFDELMPQRMIDYSGFVDVKTHSD